VRQSRQFAWYRCRVTWRRRWSGYLGIVLVIGLVGGVAMAAVAGARRTQSSFSVFQAKTNPSDLAVLTDLYQPDPTGYDPALVKQISKLPYVERVESEGGYEYEEVGPKGYPLLSALTNGGPQVALYSSIDGLFWQMDHLVVLSGRLPNPKSPTDVAVTPYAAKLLRVHVGSTIRIGVVGNAQSTSSCVRCKPIFRTTIKVVGIVISSAGLVVDDTDRSATIFATTAFSQKTLKCCLDPTISFVQISGGARHLSAVESEISRILPAHFPREFSPTASASAATAQRVIGPDAVALYIFGLIVALVALLVGAQMIGRSLKFGSDDLDVLRALGASPSMTAVDGLLGIIGAVVVGSILAGAVAVALSPLMPIGPVGPVYPDKGLSLDGLVIGVGIFSIILVLGAFAIAIGVLQAPHRARRGARQATTRPSRVVRLAMMLGLPAPAVTGIRFAVVPGRGRQSAPVRSAVVGAVVAVSVVVASLTVGASLDALASQPRLYGWNWTVAMTAAGGVGVLPEKALVRELGDDHEVAAWSGMFFSQLQIDGHSVPVLGASPRPLVAPPVLSGHGFQGRDQVVLGSETLKQLHKRVGDSVMVGVGSGSLSKLRIVGTATFPAFGGQIHTEMGTGALLDYQLIPPASRNLFDLPGGGPNVAFVDLRSQTGVSMSKLHAIAGVLSRAVQDNVDVTTVQRPAEIADAGTLRATPSVLAAALAAGAVLALAITLVTSVRRRRRDLALLKVLGFTRRQLAATLAWQSSIAAIFGIVFGVPMGIFAGRALWSQFARSIYAVPDPVTPVVSTVLVGIGALIFATLVAWLPGRSAAQVTPAEILRSE
jgi:hypothetical protein